MNPLEEIRDRAHQATERHTKGNAYLTDTEEDRARLLAALDATLALCETWKKEFNARNEGEAMLRAASRIIRDTIVNALKVTK